MNASYYWRDLELWTFLHKFNDLVEFIKDTKIFDVGRLNDQVGII